MQTPRYLKPGDSVGIVSTARKISEEEVQPAIEILESWGLKVIKGKFLHEQDHQFAGTIQQRTHDFQSMLNNHEVRAVFCARGGYGTVQIIDDIDWSCFRREPKWIVGFSDVTVLHSHIQKHCGIETIHGIMPVQFAKEKCNEGSIQSLYNALFSGRLEYHFPSHPLNREGVIQAPLTGGNLSILYSLLGSNSDNINDNKILFIEDLDEYLYHIHRMMMNLSRNLQMSHLKGLIVGGMSDMKDNTVPFGKSAEEIVQEFIQKNHYPVCFNFPAGHIKDNNAMILGRDAYLEVKPNKCTFIQV
jgi:muramoyltetrapeptide carboxypeptidase